MPNIPPPVVSAIDLRSVGIRRFQAPPFYEANCLNCSWRSYTYPTEDQAADAATHHSEACCARLNEELASQIQGIETLAEDLRFGDHILMRDLRTMLVHNVEQIEDQMMVTYDRGEPQFEVMFIPMGRVVKVVV